MSRLSFFGAWFLSCPLFAATYFGEIGATAVANLQNGSFIVAGSSTEEAKQQQFALLKLTESGEIDTEDFGNKTGKVFTDVSPYCEFIKKIVIEPNGNIVAGGNIGSKGCLSNEGGRSTESIALVRYLPNGNLDFSFGNKGIFRLPMSDVTLGDFIRISDGSFLVSMIGKQSKLFKLTPSGAIDSNFGIRTLDDFSEKSPCGPGNISELILSGDSVFLGGGRYCDGKKHPTFTVSKYHLDGYFDENYGKKGTVRIEMPYSYRREPSGMVLLDNGTIAVIGHIKTGTVGGVDSQMILNMVDASGRQLKLSSRGFGAARLSNGFNRPWNLIYDQKGQRLFAIGSTVEWGTAVGAPIFDVFQGIAAFTQKGKNARDFGLGFGVGGVRHVFKKDGLETLYDAFLDSKRRLVGVGHHFAPGFRSSFFISRTLPNGAIDTTFDEKGYKIVRMVPEKFSRAPRAIVDARSLLLRKHPR